MNSEKFSVQSTLEANYLNVRLEEPVELDEIAMKEAIQNLTEREKRIVSLRFLKGKTQMEVAEEVGISQAQVSRLEKGALDKIKDAI